MAPPASSDEPTRHKKSKKHKSDKEEKKRHKKNSQERPVATEDAPPSGAAERKKRKHEEGREEKRDGKKKSKKEGKAADAEAVDGRDAKMKRAMQDERFAAARMDPRFRPMRKKEAKVELDSRFSSMMTDPRFASSAAPVDKRGRRRKKAAKDNPMLHYYLNQDEEEEGGKEKEKEEKEKVIDEDEAEEVETDEEQEEEESSSSDDDEEDEYVDDDADSIGSDIAHYLMARHDDTPMIDKETHRLAVVNMDWDHIKAVDLYMVMTSCLPSGGRVLSVSVYPSEFGLKCMEIESTQGPAALVDANADDNDDRDDIHDHGGDNADDDGEDISDENISDDDDDEEQEVDSDKENNKLRAYELNRLRYYYAVVVCDSSATANHLYMNLDGTEFLKTANVFDLQFIPDCMEFKHPARDVATEAPPNYKEPDFETRALQHSRVKLSWDDDEPERKKVLRRKFTDDQLDELDMYLASDDSASDGEDMDNSGDEPLPNGTSKRKLTKEERLAILLQGNKSDEEQSDDQDMEITFNTELEDLSKRILERKNNEEKTVWEKHQEKMKEKRKARKRGQKESDDYSSEDKQDDDDDFFAEELSDEETKPSKSKKQKVKTKDKAKGKEKSTGEHLEQEATKEELELLVAADHDTNNGAKGYNLKRKKGKKGKKGKEESVEDKLPDIDLSKDERFSEMFTSNLYAVDPTDPQYKRSAVFMRKQAGKEGARAGKADLEPPMERSDLGGTLPPDDAVTKRADQKPDGASTEKLQILSAVKSLKRNLSSFKHASKGGR
ncbi:hypothetical protein EJB05_12002 [Eragrostis curvula]|uniref:Uncharacterized protein n=1 Tax=Eragrostis curvula TaxID=38414 RepID=A0A5J9VS12_9POAL|nr:hypothetical protein EJB05_12002 [Eragrostis curvula]